LKTTKKTLFGLGTLMLAVVCCLDTASAQTLAASPSMLTFTSPSGLTPQVLTISSSSQTTVNITSFPSWIQFSPSTGTTPLMVTVSIGPGAPANGGGGFITVNQGGANQISVPVTLTAGGGGGTLSASPSSLTYTFAPGSTVPSSQNVTIMSSSSSVTSFTVAASTTDGGQWITVSNPNNGLLTGNPPTGSISVTVSPGSLPTTGTSFTGTVTISGGGQSTVIPVNVTITNTPSLSATPTSLSFAFQVMTTAPPAQTLTLATSTSATVSISATTKTAAASMAACGTGWLIVSPQSSTAPGTLSVSVNTTGLNPTTCQGEVDISGTGISNSPVVVPVSLLISASPLLIVPSPGPTFTYQPSTGMLTPPSQSVQITSSSSQVNFVVTVAGSPNFLQVNPLGGTTGTTTASLNLTINQSTLATLAPGTYINNVTVSSSGAANSPSFPVTLVVSNTAALSSTPPSLTFNYQIGQPFAATQVLTINSSAAPLNFTVAANSTTCPGFLSATAFNGLNGFTFGNQNQVTVTVNNSGLTGNPAACTGNLTFTVPGSSAPALAVPVTLNVSTTPLLNVGVPSINVTALAGSSSTTQMVSLTSTGAALPFNAVATTNPMGLTWLSVTPNSGTTPNSLVVTINPAGLAAGTYTGTITVQPPQGSTSTYPAQTIPVVLIIASANVTVTPASLTFNQALGGQAPPFQTLQATGVPTGTTIGASITLLNGTGWLTANVAANTVTVTANGSALPQGTYNGVVTVIVPGASNNPFNIPITLVVGAPQTLSLSATTVNFSYQLGGATPAPQTVQLSSSAMAVPFTATFVGGTTSPAGLVTIAPASGMTPSPLVLSLSQTVLATLAAGTYSGNVVVSSTAIPGGDMSIKVNLTVSAAAAPIIASIVNGASFAPGPVSPGEIISIFGSNMGPTPGIGFTPVNGKIDVTLVGTQVLFDNVPAPMIFVSGGQINAIVPYEVASLVGTGQGTKVTVVRNGVASNQLVLGLAATSPAIFSSLQTGNGQGAILNQNLSANSVSNPAVKGTFVSIYATGEGSLTPFVPNGTIMPLVLPLPAPIAKVTVTIGGQPATINYAGEAPGLVAGVLQVNAMVPATIGSGPQQVVITIGTNSNNTQVINVAVQ
jgi:uncharacterized protein (TIGR03437 family)